MAEKKQFNLKQHYEEVQKKVEDFYLETIFPKVSKSVFEFLDSEILPRLDERLDIVGTDALRTGHFAKPTSVYLEVHFVLSQNKENFYLGIGYNQPIITIPKVTTDYDLLKEVLERIIAECLDARGIAFKEPKLVNIDKYAEVPNNIDKTVYLYELHIKL